MRRNNSLKCYQPFIKKINNYGSYLEPISDLELRQKSMDLKQRAYTGTSLDTLLIEAFALVCEASWRTLKMRPFDVQIAAAIAMHQGKLVEMQTGEGKTLAAVLTAYLNALQGHGIHILTFNDYLAHRDANWMGSIYHLLGLTVSFVRAGMSRAERKEAYQSDIVYVTAQEAGFDFLRDNRSPDAEEQVQRGFNLVLVDEADSILIDEARVPLVIAGETPVPHYDPYALATLVHSMEKGKDYEADEYSRDVNYTDKGILLLERYLGVDLHNPENNQLMAALNMALQAETLLIRDIDYIVREGKLLLVDAFTGRIAESRRWPYGLQTAIEAKEGLEIQPEGQILGSITLQHFLKLYQKIGGMTATAKTSEEEFKRFYNLDVMVIPPNRPCIREDHPNLVFTHKAARLHALVEEIAGVHATGRPVLVGTASVEESEVLAEALLQSSVQCNVLNAKNDREEADIITDSGALYAVTISTNMAGRGTDIRLGGKNQETREQVLALEGLYVIGTNLHESRRIDQQLRGRAGRQGDPGASRFFISMEDELMVRYNLKDLIPKHALPAKQKEAIDVKAVNREIARAQRIVEGENFEIRKTLYNFSLFLEEQRKITFEQREMLLHNRQVPSMLADHPQTCRRYETLCAKLGKDIVFNVERQLTLYFIDHWWTYHLDNISRIREGIHFFGLAGKNPFIQFQELSIKAFEELHQKMECSIVELFNRVEITSQGIATEKEGLKRPSSTWTYMINDMPFDNPMKAALMSNNSFAFASGLFFAPYLPIILVLQAIRKLFRKKRL